MWGSEMLYEVVLRQEYYGQEVLNRWHYNGSGTPAAVSLSFALTKALGFIPLAGVFPSNTLFSALRGLQASTLAYLEVEVTALYDVVDFYTRPFVGATKGLNTNGLPESPLLAYGLQSNRVVSNIRRGNKRLAGVDEGGVGAGGVLEAAYVTLLQDVADEMSEVVTYDDEGNTLTFTPCVLSFEEYTAPSGRPAYQKYGTLSEQLDHAALGVLWSPVTTIRSQVSRQYGRGR